MSIEIDKAGKWYESFNAALKTLEPKAFKLWSYLAAKQDGWVINFWFSERDIENIGLSKGQLNTAFTELLGKGYLVKPLDVFTVDYIFRANLKELDL